MSTFKFSAILFIFLLFPSSSHSKQFIVGDDVGWALPSTSNQLLYNDWASRRRFRTNDTLRFLYKKDSVMEVTDDDYDQCRSTHPTFFANDGDTNFTLDRPGLFYFISGVAGHCHRGLKMAVKVLDPPPPPPPHVSLDHSSPTTTSAAAAGPYRSFFPIVLFSFFFRAF